MTKDNIIKEDLIELYKNKKLQIKEIADIYNTTIAVIKYRIKKHKIELNNKKVYYLPKKGSKFYRLEFVKEVENRHNKKYWLCECECGNIKEYDYYSILSGSVKSCGCYHKDNVKKYNWKGYERIPGKYWSSLKDSAKKRNIKFDITIKYVWELFENQKQLCKLSGLPIDFETKNHKINVYQASLDRIDSDNGYIVGNVQWVTKEVNYMKHKIKEKIFLDFCEIITKNNKKT